MQLRVDVSAKGAVVLGPAVVCDGFIAGTQVRVQTHVHDDHMADFARAKGNVNAIVASAETRALLINEYNADLRHRANFIGVPFHDWFPFVGGRIMLIPSGHMLGAAQTVVEYQGAERVGYSGDFSWPLPEAIKVDTLVVDSTYGESSAVRLYSQDDADNAFLSLVRRELRRAPVVVKAYRGTIQRALEILTGNVEVPILASPRLCRELNIYRHYGRLLAPVTVLGTDAAAAARAAGRYVELLSKLDGEPQRKGRVYVRLSAFLAEPNDPVVAYAPDAYLVALSDHADFPGTLEYVKATGAKLVITDNTRRHGIDLALAIRSRLAIEARPSTNFASPEWGVG